VTAKRARLYDVLALVTATVIVALDQLTKSLVILYLSPPGIRLPTPVIGDYLTFWYIQNNGAAFSMFSNSIVLALLIIAAVCVITYLYTRILNSGPLLYKLIFGLIIGGAAGNLLDRAIHGGYVVDFIFFRIPQIGFKFAIFNLADASISIGVVSLLLLVFFKGIPGGVTRTPRMSRDKQDSEQETGGMIPPEQVSGTLRSTNQDAQP
jgi:signal peptidase II